MDDLDRFEDELIGRFLSHPVLRHIDQLAPAAFVELLLQRRFVSFHFTQAYDMAIDVLRDRPGVRLARTILREEYPDPSGRTPSHREDLRDDLLAFGVPRGAMLRSRRSATTDRVIEDTEELIGSAGRSEHPDVALLTFLRFWGEVLVSAEYGVLWSRMAPTFSAEQPSRFYRPHLLHDAKAHPLGQGSGRTHSDRLGMRLGELLASPGARACFRDVEDRVVVLKSRFYDQFRPP